MCIRDSLKVVDSLADCRSHDVVGLVAGVGDTVVDPEGGGRGVLEHVPVAYPEAFRHLVGAGVDLSLIHI